MRFLVTVVMWVHPNIPDPLFHPKHLYINVSPRIFGIANLYSLTPFPGMDFVGKSNVFTLYCLDCYFWSRPLPLGRKCWYDIIKFKQHKYWNDYFFIKAIESGRYPMLYIILLLSFTAKNAAPFTAITRALKKRD